MAGCSSTTDPNATKGSNTNPFVLKKGITFTLVVRIKKPDGSAFDLSNYTGRAQMRKLTSDVGTPVATFTVTIHPTETGRADVVLGATESLAIPVDSYVFDVEFELNSDPDQVLAGGSGFIQVVDAVTK